ncbi:MAG: ribonuclease P protein component [Candidatus Peribacteraceae bacterium]|nr:ribonuclease P protein component [Candidatus Peribacteraceae bacterium]
MKPLHLHGRKVCQHVLTKGTFWRGKTMTIRWLSGVPLPVWRELKERAPQGLYIGTFAPLSLSKRAVDRNRMRRRIREALRILLKEEQEFPAAQLLLAPRSSSLSCDFAEIVADIRAFLSSLRACLRSQPRNGEVSSNS